MTASITNRPVPSSTGRRWLYALKPASWPKLIVPALLGQLLGAAATGRLSIAALGWGVAFTAFGLAFIVLLNDWGDREVDAIKRTMFPEGCSPKTIPDGILPSSTVAAAGVASAIATALCAAGAEVALGRGHAFVLGASCMLLFVAYTLPPVRLNYRGGGEIIEMLGVGAALPLYNVYLQAGRVTPQALVWVAGFSALSLASGVASGLSDEESDRAGGKRTYASTFGNAAARRLTEWLVLFGAGIWGAAALLRPDWAPLWAAIPAVAIVGWNYAAMRSVSEGALTNAFAVQSAYKRFLHHAIWHSTTVAAVILWLHSSLE